VCVCVLCVLCVPCVCMLNINIIFNKMNYGAKKFKLGFYLLMLRERERINFIMHKDADSTVYLFIVSLFFATTRLR
jgi:hypothetical protein